MPGSSKRINSLQRPRIASAWIKCRRSWASRRRLSNGEAVRKSQLVLLCVKPQMVEEVLRQVADDLTANHLLISVAASVSTGFMENILAEPGPGHPRHAEHPLSYQAGDDCCRAWQARHRRHIFNMPERSSMRSAGLSLSTRNTWMR